MVKLTEATVLRKAGPNVEVLSEVKSLNLWGNDLTDVSIVGKLVSAEVLSLSVNQISSLVEFSSCRNLSELYLRKNAIADLEQ